MDESDDGHMTAEDLRRNGFAAVEWVCRYVERLEDVPVLSKLEPGAVRAELPAKPPETPEPFETMLADVDRVIVPGITHWQSPNFFAYFPANNSGPSMLGELVSAAFGVQGMLWMTSPACTELEAHMLDWLVDLLDLPDRFRSSGAGGGVIQDSASSANLCALLAARERATAGETNRTGIRGRLTAYATSQTHSSVEKAARIAGIGSENVRLVDVDAGLAMRADALERAIESDIASGNTPVMVAATVGTTSTLAVDPLHAIGPVCARHGVWLHVDAAMAGTAGLCPEFRWIHDGLEFADSYCFDPHKWMLTNFDCSAFFVADRCAIVSALSILPEYLRNPATEAGAVIDYRDWQIPLGRRLRALKLWFVIRYYGTERLRRMVRRHVALAQQFAQWVGADDRFEIRRPQNLTLVCFRHRGGDDVNEALLERINDSGIYLTHTKVDGKYTLRMSIGQARTELHHVEHAWRVIQEAAPEVAGAGNARRRSVRDRTEDFGS